MQTEHKYKIPWLFDKIEYCVLQPMVETFALYYLSEPLGRNPLVEVSIVRFRFLNGCRLALVQVAIFEKEFRFGGRSYLYPIQVIALLEVHHTAEMVRWYEIDTLYPKEYHDLSLLSGRDDQVLHYRFITTDRNDDEVVEVEIMGIRRVREKGKGEAVRHPFRRINFNINLRAAAQ